MVRKSKGKGTGKVKLCLLGGCGESKGRIHGNDKGKGEGKGKV